MNPVLHKILWLAALLFGSLQVLVGLFLALAGLSTLWKRLVSFRWDRVPGRIVASEVRAVPFGDQGTRYQSVISYTFLQGGSRYEGRQASFTGRLHARREKARHEAERFPVGTMVMVWCNPSSPEETVLERRGAGCGMVLLLFGLALVGLPLALAAKAGLAIGPIALAIALLGALIFLFDWLGARRAETRNERPGRGSDEDVVLLLRQGKKRDAIRRYRKIHGVGLREAKRRVTEMGDRLDE